MYLHCGVLIKTKHKDGYSHRLIYNKNVNVQKNICNILYFLQEEEKYKKMHMYLLSCAKYVWDK